MIIKYNTSKFVKSIGQLEVEDTKNIFLKGRNSFDNTITYFGIWKNQNYLVIVKVLSDRNINYEYSKMGGIYTENYIKTYLEFNNNVSIISREEFKEQLKKLTEKLEI